jgi:hypothetical protein
MEGFGRTRPDGMKPFTFAFVGQHSPIGAAFAALFF